MHKGDMAGNDKGEEKEKKHKVFKNWELCL